MLPQQLQQQQQRSHPPQRWLWLWQWLRTIPMHVLLESIGLATLLALLLVFMTQLSSLPSSSSSLPHRDETATTRIFVQYSLLLFVALFAWTFVLPFALRHTRAAFAATSTPTATAPSFASPPPPSPPLSPTSTSSPSAHHPHLLLPLLLWCTFALTLLHALALLAIDPSSTLALSLALACALVLLSTFALFSPTSSSSPSSPCAPMHARLPLALAACALLHASLLLHHLRAALLAVAHAHSFGWTSRVLLSPAFAWAFLFALLRYGIVAPLHDASSLLCRVLMWSSTLRTASTSTRITSSAVRDQRVMDARDHDDDDDDDDDDGNRLSTRQGGQQRFLPPLWTLDSAVRDALPLDDDHADDHNTTHSHHVQLSSTHPAAHDYRIRAAVVLAIAASSPLLIDLVRSAWESAHLVDAGDSAIAVLSSTVVLLHVLVFAAEEELLASFASVRDGAIVYAACWLSPAHVLQRQRCALERELCATHQLQQQQWQQRQRQHQRYSAALLPRLFVDDAEGFLHDDDEVEVVGPRSPARAFDDSNKLAAALLFARLQTAPLVREAVRWADSPSAATAATASTAAGLAANSASTSSLDDRATIVDMQALVANDDEDDDDEDAAANDDDPPHADDRGFAYELHELALACRSFVRLAIVPLACALASPAAQLVAHALVAHASAVHVVLLAPPLVFVLARLRALVALALVVVGAHAHAGR